MEDVARRFAAGDVDAFEALFKAHQHEVYRWIVRIVRDPAAAEDVTVEAFWRMYRGRARFDPARSFAAWARRIAVNAAIDHLKRSPRPGTIDDEDAERVVDPRAAERVVAGDARRALARAFAGLPPLLRAAAQLALIDGRPYQEIADLLGISVGGVKSRVFRATRLLRSRLIESGWHT